MKSHLPERLYLSSPVWLQNLMVSVYGYMEHKRRYGGEYSAFLNRLRNNKFLKFDENKALQKKLLASALSNATRNVPAYKHLCSSQPELSHFPLLDRQQVANNTEQFVSNEFDVKNLLTLYTGGSSASPLKYTSRKRHDRKPTLSGNCFTTTWVFILGTVKLLSLEESYRNLTIIGPHFGDTTSSTDSFCFLHTIRKKLIFQTI